MRKVFLKIALSIIGVLIGTQYAESQYMGSVTCFNAAERAGGNKYPYNQSLFLSNTGEEEWWDNIVEEIYHSGIDFSALLSRGYSPGRPSIDMGDPRKIPNMIAAMDRRGLSDAFKLAIFDDCPAGWTANHNYDQGRGHNTNTLFDCGDTANYKYIWDLNIKVALENIPDSRRFMIDDRMVIFFWSVKPRWMTNIGNGNLRRILEHIRSECQAEFGFNPYLIVQDCWFDNDSRLKASDVDGVHNWFSSANSISWTLHSRGDLPKIGVTNPGIRYEGQPDVTWMDPRHGQTLINGLEGTVNSGALITLCEGFTDAAETAAYWRSKDTTYYDYPNQRIDILRRYSQNAFLDRRMVQAEACDFYHDITPGNKGASFRLGDIDICKTSDVFGGWNVFDAEAQEWLEWKELPFPKNSQIEVRYAAEDSAKIQFVLDDQEGAILSLEPTGGEQLWSLLRDTSFIITEDTSFSVKIKIISGKISINYFNIMGEASIGKVAIASPLTGDRYLQSDTIRLKADVLGFADSLQKLEVYLDTTLISSYASPTINTFLTDLPFGDHFIKVKATDENGNFAIDSCQIYIGKYAYTINDSIIGSGTVSFDPPGGTYVEGTVVSVFALGESPAYFNGWSGDIIRSDNPLILTMNKNIDLSATFISPSDDAIRINFQPDASVVPDGYLKDVGLEYGTQYNGYTYGWVGGPNPALRDRGTPEDVRYATLDHMQIGGDHVWEMEVENGNYMVYLVMGDPSYTDQINAVNVEGVWRDDIEHVIKFDEFRLIVKVEDNNLTIAPGKGAENAKICFVEIALDTINPVDSVTPIDTTVSIENIKLMPQNSYLKQNYPNPFSYQTEISFNLARTGFTRLTVHNIHGQSIKTLVNEQLTAGTHQISFEAGDLTSGMYFYKIQSGNFSKVRKMLLSK